MRKKMVWFAGLATAVITVLAACATGGSGEWDFRWEEDGDGVRITSYWGETTDVMIPPQIRGKTVVSIGAGAFLGGKYVDELRRHRPKLTSVVIPDSVISIGQDAFRSNQLTSVVIPDSVTSIGQDAFRNNQLASVVILDSVTSIGMSAFRENQLASITMGNNVTSIDYGAFKDNQLASVTIGNGVTSIRHEAFLNNRLVFRPIQTTE